MNWLPGWLLAAPSHAQSLASLPSQLRLCCSGFSFNNNRFATFPASYSAKVTVDNFSASGNMIFVVALQLMKCQPLPSPEFPDKCHNQVDGHKWATMECHWPAATDAQADADKTPHWHHAGCQFEKLPPRHWLAHRQNLAVILAGTTAPVAFDTNASKAAGTTLASCGSVKVAAFKQSSHPLPAPGSSADNQCQPDVPAANAFE